MSPDFIHNILLINNGSSRSPLYPSQVSINQIRDNMSLFSATIIYFQMNVKLIFFSHSRFLRAPKGASPPAAPACARTLRERAEGEIGHGSADQAGDAMAVGFESPPDHRFLHR